MTAERDVVLPFVFDALPVRGAVIQLESAWQRMLEGRAYRRPVLEALGHSAAASALIAQSLKFDGSITLQISGDGPLAMLVVQCTSRLELRGMASAERVGDDGLSFADLVSNARCAVTVDAAERRRSYQGIVEVSGPSLAASLEHYYARSAQIPTWLALVSDAACAGGILLQQLPGNEPVDAEEWRRLGALAATLALPDLSGGIGPGLLQRLFAEDDLRVFRPREAVFRCRCSDERVETVLRLLGRREAEALLAAEGRVEVTCEYCARVRRYDAAALERVFGRGWRPPGVTLH
ncbi:MAG TPA: Hsp33 family molecular chaperone HslO [Woeseiaceae bacterium]|nr:Hsp33 family molecular chaperone HslO [Woeseiaceae bacterium]